MRFETLATHAGERPDKMFGAISIPIYQTSTFVFEDMGKTRGMIILARQTQRGKS